MVFPVSSVMLDRIENYRGTSRAHSGPLMNFIERRPTLQRNVEVLNDMADLYRYFRLHRQCGVPFFGCVERTVDRDFAARDRRPAPT
jgi:hypothetical protein